MFIDISTISCLLHSPTSTTSFACSWLPQCNRADDMNGTWKIAVRSRFPLLFTRSTNIIVLFNQFVASIAWLFMVQCAKSSSGETFYSLLSPERMIIWTFHSFNCDPKSFVLIFAMHCSNVQSISLNRSKSKSALTRYSLRCALHSAMQRVSPQKIIDNSVSRGLTRRLLSCVSAFDDYSLCRRNWSNVSAQPFKLGE